MEVAQGGCGSDVFIGGGRYSVFVRGGEGDDILIGGAANDALSGEDGNDLIGGGQGDDTIDGGDGIDVAEYSGSYADYRITRTADGFSISDTVSGRDGTDFLENVEKLNFRDTSLLDPTLANPLPVKDVLSVDKSGAALVRGAGAYHFTPAQFLGNDIDLQGNALAITQFTDMQGGSVSVEAGSGDVVFVPTAGFTGVMGFKYTISDSEGHPAATVTDLGTGQTAASKAAVFLRTGDLPSDALVTDEWYLTAANILPVWKDYTGKGVRVGVFDPGGPYAVTREVFDYRHPDLQPTVDAQWLAEARVGFRAGEGSEGNFSTHATLVAGVIAAAKNGEGAVGVAYDATIAGHFVSPSSEVQQMPFYNYDIANNSWHPTPRFSANFDEVKSNELLDFIPCVGSPKRLSQNSCMRESLPIH